MTGIFVLMSGKKASSQIDSIPSINSKEKIDSIIAANINSDTAFYIVVFKTEQKMIHPKVIYKYLSYYDFRTVILNNVVYYIIKDFREEYPVYIRPCPNG